MADQRETPSGYDGLLTDIKQEEEMGMQQAHISALQTKHAGLDARIAEENQRPLPDMATLARLKKEKLRVKEALSGLA
ncbi:MAG TPA: YdcH family protein [Allosphingosinicella sp.]|nr:YdcH family protein [Allosphingosinicella sp.]